MVSCNKNTSSSKANSSSRSRIFTKCSKSSKVALTILVAALTASSTGAFQSQSHPRPSFVPRTSSRTSRILPSGTSPKDSSTAQSMTLEDVNTFYQTYPLQAAVLTCGVKASLADCIAQIRSWTESEHAIELRRNAAYIIYGGIFIGLMCHIEYDVLFPALFGTTHDVKTVAEEVLFDNFVSAPLMWLPPAYFIKAIMYDYPLKEGLDRYLTDIMDEGLLNKYWSVWLPAQTISFSFVPDQLRVLFMACVSFGWFIILSSSQSQTDDSANAALVEETETEEEAVAVVS